MGQDPLNQCTDGGAAACGNDGTCNGAGACRLYISGTQCVAPTCSGTTSTPARTCNGTGTCQTVSTSSCSPFACGATTCKTTCATDADCASPFVCLGTACAPNPNLKVQYLNAATAATSQAIKPHFMVLNGGSSAVALSSLTIRYWYTEDTPVDTELSQCDYAQLGCNNIVLSNVTLSPTRPTADRYFQVGFATTAGNLAATNGTTGEIQIWFHKTGWTNYTQTNDPSFDATKTGYADWNRVTLYQNGTLVWGTEPAP
jgi:hypothetical protein